MTTDAHNPEPEDQPVQPKDARPAPRELAVPDPARRETLRRVQLQLLLFKKAMQASGLQELLQESRRAQDEAIRQFGEALRASFQAMRDDLAAHGLPAPQTLEDWEHLARIVEMPFETVQSGQYTAADVYAMALAWVDRQKVRERIVRQEAQTTAESPRPSSDVADRPEPDPLDTRKALWMGKRIYLGDNTEVSRLFWLLAKPIGAAHTLGEVQLAIDGMETDRNHPQDEVKKAGQRVRKVVSKLRAALREAGLDDHVLIVRGGTQAEPEYTLVWRYPR